ncbi:MAG TPA: glycosyltransferase [Gemmataceae bacterium]|nr:glycosyltransferase [Gemmataceae bacterium]
MRIGIEMRLVTMGGAGGIAMLLRGVLRSLFERNPQHQFTCFTTVFNRGLLGDVPANVELNTLPLGSYFEDVGKLCALKNVNVLFRGYPLEQHVDFPLHRQIVEIPDIQHEYFPEFFDEASLRSRRAAFGKVLAGAGAIGTISDFARRTLLEQPGTRCRDIFLMCPALQVEHHRSEALTDSERMLIPTGDYFLFPANLWKHKNHARVLSAFERLLKATDRRVQFVCTGHPDGWDAYQKQFGHLPIRHLGFVRPALLRKLLEGARALVFFSLYEGFGMPLLEAFDAGTPVLCSNTTSLPEVGGDAVLSCDPTDIDAMSGLMARIFQEPELGQELVRRGKERLKAYSWEQSADNLMAACERVGRPRMQPLPSITSWPRLALVTPSFNQGRFLRRTIDSVLAQQYPQLDYIVMDAGSRDETLDVLRSYGERVRWICEPDRGQSHAINKGLALVKGDIVGYLNSDDTLLPGALEKVARHMLAHPECDLVYGKAHFIDADDRVIGDYNTADYSFERLMEDCCISQPAAFWRRRIADKIGAFDEALHLAMDYDYWQRMALAGGRIEHLPEFLACTRMHEDTKTLSRRTAVFDEAIRVSMKNTGAASLAYFQGLWHHRLFEKSHWEWFLRRIPHAANVAKVAGRLHHRWANRATYSNREFLRDTGQALKKRVKKKLKPLVTLAQPFVKYVSRARAKQLLGATPKQVVGYWGDNWMAETCVVRLKESAGGEDIVFCGIATEPMDLTVTVDDKVHCVFPLKGRELESMKFHLEPGGSRKVALQFSKHMVDSAGRKLSFMLQGTNLFAEQDLT